MQLIYQCHEQVLLRLVVVARRKYAREKRKWRGKYRDIVDESRRNPSDKIKWCRALRGINTAPHIH